MELFHKKKPPTPEETARQAAYWAEKFAQRFPALDRLGVTEHTDLFDICELIAERLETVEAR